MRTNPWVAWPAGSDPAELATRLRVAHELFVTGGRGEAGGADGAGPTGPWAGAAPGRTRAAVRRVVLDSWVRSRSSGVDPERVSPPVDLTGADLASYRRGHVLAPLMPIVRRLLVDGGGSEGMIVALADETGRLLWVDGDRVVRRAVERVGFVEGARWSERDAGTNAPGIALATDHEVQIFAAEHFTRAVQTWSCSAAPVHDPVTGRVLGVLDVTGRDPAASPQMLSLVRATVAAMESELAVRALRARLSGRGGSRPARSSAAAAKAVTADRVTADDVAADRVTADRLTADDGPAPARAGDPLPSATPRLEVLGTSSGTLVRGGEQQALTLRHTELLLLLGAHPAGLTGDELAVLMHPGTLSDVTVRAEMSRLRRAVGVLVGASRPYRLSSRLRTDVAEVRDHLARGDVAAAVDAYRGPVLPRSEAPGVISLREEVASELRTALRRTDDVGALEAWTLSPAGADDWSSWRRLLALHNEGTPGWIRARAHVDLLDLELGASSIARATSAQRT